MYKHLNISITLCGEETCTDELQISLDDVIRSADVAGRIGTLIGEGYREGTFDFHIEDNACPSRGTAQRQSPDKGGRQ